MSIKVKLKNENGLSVKLKNQDNLKVRSSIAATQFSELEDVDMSNLTDGSRLVYSTALGKWVVDNNI